MIFFLAFLLVSMLGVSGYIAQVLGWVSAISAFIGMIILAVLIYYATMWLTAGDEMVTAFVLWWATVSVNWPGNKSLVLMIAIFYIGLSRRREKCQLAGTFVVRISKNEQVNSFFSPFPLHFFRALFSD